MKPKHYDLIVIGSGPAGEKGAAQSAYFGKKVALIERNSYLGGAAASTTIPSKTLRETSLALSGIRARRLHGVDLSLKRRATVQDFLHHERKVKDAERIRVKENTIISQRLLRIRRPAGDNDVCRSESLVHQIPPNRYIYCHTRQ